MSTSTELWDRLKVSDQYKEFKRLVRKRAGYVCEVCGHKKSRKIPNHVHHLKPKGKFPHLTFKVINGQLLCRDCHIEAHKQMRIDHPTWYKMEDASARKLENLLKKCTFSLYNTRNRRNKTRNRNRRRGR